MAQLNDINGASDNDDDVIIGRTNSSLRQIESYRLLSGNGEYIIDVSPTYYNSNTFDVGTLANYTGEWNFKIKSPPITDISPNTNVTGTLNSGDVHFYAFEATAGDKFNVAFLGENLTADVSIVIEDSSNNVLKSISTRNYGETSRGFYILTTGLHIISISGASTDSYTLGLSKINEPIPVNLDTELSGNFTVLGSHQLYSFTSPENGLTGFEISHPSTSQLWAMAHINEVNGVGDIIGATDSSIRQIESSRSLSGNGEYIIDLSPTYYNSDVSDVGALVNYTGEWNFQIKSLQITDTEISPNTNVTGTLSGDVNSYVFEATAGDKFNVAFLGENLTTDVNIVVEDPNNNTLGSITSYPSSAGSYGETGLRGFDILTTGSHTISIISGASTGSYTLGLSKINEPIPVDLDTELSGNFTTLGSH